MSQELTAALLPTGKLQLEWNQPSARIGKDQDLLQKELYLRWQEEFGLFLLHLGFCDPAIRLSDSLSYWRSVCALYAGTSTHDLCVTSGDVTLAATAPRMSYPGMHVTTAGCPSGPRATRGLPSIMPGSWAAITMYSAMYTPPVWFS